MKRRKIFGLVTLVTAIINSQPSSAQNQEILRQNEVYVEDVLPIKTITIEDVLQDAKVFPNRVNIKEADVIVLYLTSDWCPPCRIIDQQNFSEELMRIYKDKPMALIKVDLPKEGTAPEIFSKLGLDNVPHIRIYENLNGSLRFLAEVTDINKALVHTRQYVKYALLDKLSPPESISIDKEGFKRYSVGFFVNYDKDDYAPGYDIQAIIESIARFGAEKEIYDFNDKKGEVTITLNLENPEEFAFARRYDYDPNVPRNTNRNILARINDVVHNSAMKKRKEDPSYAKNGDIISSLASGIHWIDLSTLSQQELEAREARYYNFHFQTFHFTDSVIPSYINQAFSNFVTNAQAQHHGSLDSVTYIEEMTSPILQEAIEDWSKKNDKKLDIKHLPNEEELRLWARRIGLTNDELFVLLNSLDEMKSAYKKLNDLNIIYADTTVPLPPVSELMSQYKTGVILRDVSLADTIATVHRAYSTNKTANETDMLEVFMQGARYTKQNEKKIGFFYLPFVQTKLGFIHAPFTYGPGSYTDTITDPSYNDALFIFREDRLIARIFPHEVDQPKRFIEKLETLLNDKDRISGSK